jgi:MFS family permease
MKHNHQRKSDPLNPGPATAPSWLYFGQFYYGWIIVAACFLVIAPVSPLFTSFSIFQSPILHEFHWSRGSFAIALSIYLVVGGVATPFAGGLIDRFSARRVMPIGALLTALALILMSRGVSLWHFYVAYGLMAAGSSLLQIVPLTAIVANWFARHRGMAIGIVNAGSGAGQLTLLPAIKLLIDCIGWRHTYLVFGLTILVIPTTLILLFLHSRPEDRGLSIDDEAGASPKASGDRANAVILDEKWAEADWTVGGAALTFRFWALALVMTLFAAGTLLISTQLMVYLGDKGYGSIIVASVAGLQGALNMIGQFLGGFFCDRIGREKTMTLSLVSFGAGIIFLNLAGAAVNPALVYVFTLFYGVGQGMAVPTLMILASDLFQGKHFGSILGMIFLGGYFGGALGAWLSGRLFDVTGAYQINFIISGLAMLISAALIWKARPGAIRQARGLGTR